MAAAGVKVMATVRTLSALELLFKEVREEGGEASFSVGNPGNQEDVKRVVKDTVDMFGGIDILVTVAGINKVKPIVEQSVQDWEEVMDVNVKGSYLFCKEVGKVMINQAQVTSALCKVVPKDTG